MALCASALAAEPFTENFDTTAAGKLPANTMVLSGDFAVREEDGRKFLELPGAPLETFGFLFGPPQTGDTSASARFFGTKQGRKYPAFALSLGGPGGYRLQVSGGKKALEIFKGDQARQAVPFEYPSGVWTTLRLQLRKTAGGCIVEGKAWSEGVAEPPAWTITLEEPSAPPTGRAGLWGAPYSGTPIRFDDLRVEALPSS